MRLYYRLIVPAEPDADSAQDRARLLIQGEPIALDPWTLSSVTPDSAGLVPEPALDGSWFDSPLGLATPWTDTPAASATATMRAALASVTNCSSAYHSGRPATRPGRRALPVTIEASRQ